MSQAQQRVSDEMDSFAMLPSQAAAVFDMILAWEYAHREKAVSLADRAVLRLLAVQGDCFRAAGVLWTGGMEGWKAGALAEMDAKGPIQIQMAMPQSVLLAYACEGYDWHMSAEARLPVHSDVRKQMRGMDQVA